PPAISTLPSPSRVAVCCCRSVFMLPVTVQVPAAALHSSALIAPPPAASTSPLGSKVSVWDCRGQFMLPVFVHVPEVCARVGAARPRARRIVNTRGWFDVFLVSLAFIVSSFRFIPDPPDNCLGPRIQYVRCPKRDLVPQNLPKEVMPPGREALILLIPPAM